MFRIATLTWYCLGLVAEDKPSEFSWYFITTIDTVFL